MNRDDLCYESTVSLARRIRAGEVSPRDAVDAYLKRIERVDPRVHGYLHVAADHALRAARRAEQALAGGCELGALHGVPVAVKDLFDTAGIPTTCGSPRILGSNVPARTATAVERLERARGGLESARGEPLIDAVLHRLGERRRVSDRGVVVGRRAEALGLETHGGRALRPRRRAAHVAAVSGS